ncbi:hypothetical protein H257_15253 [Aphanomyces astaci]|uniref:Methyltransferase domain-containing protein n=1 Tax=Aphanomyces astaci TaxID=112090 RepID=W4FPM6_APHAT|nr:hypothetical protein H257_15253 [Aphanomyces astaci]ETV68906.1 hypothetical protein H257_15253 [Aphanomyces astaci]|eukprot:XP_009841583.1 hypothetical protein H257_15253 [Aphanomyces astaci]
MAAAAPPTLDKASSYDDLYASEAVSKGVLQYVNMGLHPVDNVSLGNPKTHDLVQPQQQQLYLALLTLPRVQQLVERAASEQRSLHVLDVGCGTGASLQLIQTVLRAFSPSVPIVVVGIDKSHVAVKQHKRLFYGKHDKNHRGVLHYDIEHQRMSAFSRHRFDIVLGVQSFHEMKANPDAAIAEVARVLKPQGVLLAADFYSKNQPFMTDFLGKLRHHPSFDLHFAQDVSHSATIAAKLTSIKIVEALTQDEIVQFASLLTLKKSPQYEAVRLGSVQFGLVGYHSVVEIEDDVILHDHVIDDVINDQASDDDIDDIDDSMNPSYYDYTYVQP